MACSACNCVCIGVEEQKEIKQVLLDEVDHVFQMHIIEELQDAVHSGQIKTLDRLSWLHKNILIAQDSLVELIETIFVEEVKE